jgi:carbon starvation protein
MNGMLLLAVAIIALVLAYIFYGRRLERTWGIDPNRKTPAFESEDGVDYVPSLPSVTFGHHFSSIAGTTPIAGPIIAAMFGWAPVFLWLIFGSIFMGAVYDFVTLYTSVRNQGKSIGYCLELYVGKTGKQLFLLLAWAFSILFASAFTDIVIRTFAGFSARGLPNKANAAVASSSILLTLSAGFLGFLIYKKKTSNLASGIIAVDLLIFSIAGGIFLPVYLDKNVWFYIIAAYILISEMSPVWMLEQPRNYLNSYLLIMLIAAGVIGGIFARPIMSLPAFTGFEVNGAYLFPSLFIFVSCGAISGFHGLTSMGVTAKQIGNEKHIRPIAFGSMFIETILAVLALIAVGSISINGKIPDAAPPVIFATAISGFIGMMGLPSTASFTLVCLAIASFALTTLNTVTRLGRLALQELCTVQSEEQPLILKALRHRITASLCTIVAIYALSVNFTHQELWPFLGTANQFLAVLSIAGCAVFLKKNNRRYYMLMGPLVILVIITFTSLILTVKGKIGMYTAQGSLPGSDGVQFIFALMLLVSGIIIISSCAVKLFKKVEK